MFTLIDVAIKTICYMGFFVGLWLFVSPAVIPLIKKQVQVNRYKNDLKYPINRKKENKAIEHIRLLLNVVFSVNNYFAVALFIMTSVSFFIITFSVLFNSSSKISFVIVLSLAAASLPYAILNFKVRTIRIDSSYEAEPLISKISNQYKISGKNMIVAIDKTIAELNDSPYSKKALFRLSLAVKEYKRPEDLKKLIHEFTYSIDTDWANILGTCLYFSINDGLDVSTSLDDTMEDLKLIRKSMERAKRDNNEAFILIKFINPILYVFFIFISMKVFGFTLQKYFQYQFNTSMGISTGVLVFVSMFTNYILYLLFKKPKYDF